MADDTSTPEPNILSRLRPPEGAVQRKKRVGRGVGSGTGKTAGRGQKGQRSRSGGRHAVFEGGQLPIYRRIPKLGFRAIDRKRIEVVNLGSLGRFDAGTVVDPETLIAAGLVSKRHDAIKILGKGSLDRALTVRAHAFSASAKRVIEEAGGKVEPIAQPEPQPESQPES
jgi:large subunit ribosomal protein L15